MRRVLRGSGTGAGTREPSAIHHGPRPGLSVNASRSTAEPSENVARQGDGGAFAAATVGATTSTLCDRSDEIALIATVPPPISNITSTTATNAALLFAYAIARIAPFAIAPPAPPAPTAAAGAV